MRSSRSTSGGTQPSSGAEAARLDHHDLAPGAREHLRRHQRIGAAADDDGAVHGAFPRICSAALRPEAPITPPPGCVPAPH